MFDMFGYCYKLITVNVSNFDTSKVKNFQGIFYQCHNLKYLDLSSFNISSATNIPIMFIGCNSLVYLKLNSLTAKDGINFGNIFESVSPNLKICINSENTINKFSSTIQSQINCSDNCFDDNIKIEL